MTTVRAPCRLDPLAHPMRELAGRELGGVDLLDMQVAGLAHGLQVEAHRAGAVEQQAQFLVEDEHGGLLAVGDRRGDELQGEGALAGAGRTEHERAGALLDAAAQQRIELGHAARHLAARRSPMRCSAATSRGNTATPPVLMVKS